MDLFNIKFVCSDVTTGDNMTRRSKIRYFTTQIFVNYLDVNEMIRIISSYTMVGEITEIRLTFACLISTIETVKKSMKFVQS